MNYGITIREAMTAAAGKVGIPGWMAYACERVDGGYLITGEVPDGVYSRGPRKGRPRFRAPGATHNRRVVLTDDDLQAIAARFEADTGKCWCCKGSGREIARLSARDGAIYRACSCCGGDGHQHHAVLPATAAGGHP